MKAKEIRDLPAEQIRDRLEQSREAYFKLRMEFTSGQLKDTAQLRRARREIARLETILSEVQRGAAAGRAGA